ncbi:CHRD domain-containing protein [Pelagivirga sediminicola]|uniref:CHRD domain-containing protein n=1 Tax=Pelagivirga sediminicola TaxID=2170575 RepID=A0A2T7G9J6_9RHOB|nr:CHRD domain-containing protein [Pelagivirga sediminicola]PVA11091.1 CHRD domain-containing protein [Pelagivirga sediminicola]
MFKPSLKQTTATLAACTMLALPAFAEELNFTADLTADAEVPATDSSATGSADVNVDTDAKTVSWTVTVQELTGDPVAAHIHGPADPGENAGPVIDMSDAVMEGSADITDEQITALKDGKYYVNVHTEKFPDGEIRGQLEAAE